MNEIYEFIKKCGTYYLATVEDGQPRNRPFGTINIFDGKLYIQTGKSKAVSKQIQKNPRVELCCFNGSEWMISNQGEATLQVIDVLGRVLSSETISGTVTVSLKETAGMYMLRLVNGNDVKVQKVVVR